MSELGKQFRNKSDLKNWKKSEIAACEQKTTTEFSFQTQFSYSYLIERKIHAAKPLAF